MKKHTFILSDETRNSYGFKVLTDGIDTSVFEANPVMLYEHSALNLVGQWGNLKKDEGRLIADAEFDDEDEMAIKVEKKVSKGILKGVSIGMEILEVGEEETPDGRSIPVVLKCKLFEASVCAMPSNTNALRLYNEAGAPIAPGQVEAYLSSKGIEPGGAEGGSNHNQKSNTNTMKLNADNLQGLGLDAEAGEAAINTAIATLLKRAATQKETLEAAQKARVETLVNGAIASGKITADKKEYFEKLAKADFESTEAILSAIEKQQKPTEMLDRKTSGKPSAKAGRESWTYDDWRKKDMKGLLAMKTDEPEKYAALMGDLSRYVAS